MTFDTMNVMIIDICYSNVMINDICYYNCND